MYWPDFRPGHCNEHTIVGLSLIARDQPRTTTPERRRRSELERRKEKKKAGNLWNIKRSVSKGLVVFVVREERYRGEVKKEKCV